MGVHLSFWNTNQKGIYPFLGQTYYCAPDENGRLFWWADPLTMVTYSLIPLKHSPITHMPYSSLLTFVLYLFRGLMVLCICFSFSFHYPPRFFTPSLKHRTFILCPIPLPFIFVFYISLGFMLLCIPSTISIHSPLWIFAPSLTQHTYVPYNLFPSLILRVVPSHNHTCTPCFTPLKPLFPFPCPTYTPSTFPHSHNHSIHNTIQSFPFTGTHNTAPLPSLSPSTPTSNSLHQLHWDPLINNEIIRSCWLQIELSWIPHKNVHV